MEDEKPGPSFSCSPQNFNEAKVTDILSSKNNQEEAVGECKTSTHTDMSHHIPAEKLSSLDLLFSSPYCWSASKIYNFWKVTYNSIKYVTDDRKNTPQHIKKFRSNLQKKAVKCNLWHPYSSWKDVLGEAHFNILKTDALNSDLWETKSVVGLMQLIRNKQEHPECGIHPDLNWFKDLRNNKTPDEYLFVKYWISKFPQLTCFLWNGFRSRKDNFREYYPTSLDECTDTFYLTPCQFEEGLYKSAKAQIDEGFLERRYSVDQRGTFKVEFINLPEVLISKLQMYDEAVAICLEVSDHMVFFRWYDNLNNFREIEYQCSSTRAILTEKSTAYIFTHKNFVTNESKKLALLKALRQANNIGRIIVFGSSEFFLEESGRNVDNLIKWVNSNNYFLSAEVKLKHFEVGFKDLSLTVQEKLQKNESEYKIRFQSGREHLEGGLRYRILLRLKGVSINDLIRKKELDLFSHKVPSPQEVYISRHLYRRDLWNPEILSTAEPWHVFIILKPTSGAPKFKLSSIKSKEVFPILKQKYCDTRVHILQDKLIDFEEALKGFKGCADETKCIHFVDYQTENECFKWRGTKGRFPFNEKGFLEASVKAGLINENQFIDELIEDNKRLVVVADYPGMGKSQVLVQFANMLMSKTRDRLVCFFTVKKFVETLSKINSNVKCLKRSNIVSTFKILLCFDSNSSDIMEYLMDGNKIAIEMFLDGLDEIEPELLGLALKALRIINSKILSVRIWLTLRDHMLDKIKKKFQLLGHKLEPFSLPKQQQFLKEYWEFKLRKKYFNRLNQDSLKKFMTACTNIVTDNKTIDIAGIPLQLWMIAEIYMDRLKTCNLDCSNLNIKLIDLYDRMIEMQLQRYIQEKRKVYLRRERAYKRKKNVFQGYDKLGMKDHITNALRDQFESDHAYYAAALLFSNDKAKELESRVFSVKRNPDERQKLVLDVGIIKDISSDIKFIHRTFAEYILVRFLFRALENFISCEHWDSTFDLVDTKFSLLWENVLNVYDAPHVYDVWFSNPTMCHFLNEICNHSSTNQMNSTLAKTIKAKKIFLFNYKTVLGDVQHAINYTYIAPVTFETFVHKKYGHMVFLFLYSSRCKLELLYRSLQVQDFEMIKFIKQHCDFSPTQWKYICCNAPNNTNALFQLFKGLEKSKVEDLDRAKECLDFLLQKDTEKKLARFRDDLGRTPLLYLVHSVIPAGFYKIPDHMLFLRDYVNTFNADINITDDARNTVLHLGNFFPQALDGGHSIITMYLKNGSYKSLLEYFLSLKNFDKAIINVFNNQGLTPLMRLLHACNRSSLLSTCISPEIKTVVCDAIKIFKDNRVEFNLRDANDQGDAALHTSIKRHCGSRICEELINAGADVCLQNREGKCAHKLVEDAIYALWNPSKVKAEVKDLLLKYPCRYQSDQKRKLQRNDEYSNDTSSNLVAKRMK